MDDSCHPRSGIAGFLLVNPRAGDEEPTAGELVEAAGRAGVEARDLRKREDVAEVLRAAADRGAEAIGIAGGDGSLSAAATVALERDLPFVCVPFGTRNHFARDLGLDTGDPLGALAAFDGRERRVDVGLVNGLVFVNNVSLGIYASLVHDPRHGRRNRAAAALRTVPAALGLRRSPLRLSFEVSGRRERRDVLVLLVANNDYRLGTLMDIGERDSLDEGLLHAYLVEAVGSLALVALLARVALGSHGPSEGWAEWAAPRFHVDSARPRVRAAIDGEAVVLAPPLEFEVRPRALRVLVP